MLKQVILFAIVLFFVGCSAKYVVNQDGGLRPKKATFFKYRNDYKFSPADKIDTSAIYVGHIGTVWFNDKDSVKDGIVFYRFYSSGHLYISPVFDVFPTLEQINNIKTGNVGYFKTESGKIKMEYLYYIDGGSRRTASGHFEGDTLIIRDQGKKSSWEKKIINGLARTRPDW